MPCQDQRLKVKRSIVDCASDQTAVRVAVNIDITHNSLEDTQQVEWYYAPDLQL